MTTKKTNHSEIESQDALPPEADALARFDKLAAALHEAGAAITAGLAEEAQISKEQGACDVAGGDVAQLVGRFNAVRAHREAAVRKRSAAVEALVKLEPELLQARRDADEARGRLAGAAISELQREWTETVERLAEIHGKVQVFQEVMRTQVSLPAPYRSVVNLQGVPVLQFAAAVPPAALPVSLQAFTALIDKLDAAVALAGGIRASREQDARHRRLAQERRAPGDMPAVYAALRPITHWGATFAAGDLVDATVINTSALYRLSVARCVAVAGRAA